MEVSKLFQSIFPVTVCILRSLVVLNCHVENVVSQKRHFDMAGFGVWWFEAPTGDIHHYLHACQGNFLEQGKCALAVRLTKYFLEGILRP